MKPGSTVGAIHLLVSLAFLSGVAGEAYGPHAGHGHDRGSGHHRLASETTGAAAHPASTEPGPRTPPRTPCTCIGTCHGAAAAPVPTQPTPCPGIVALLVRPEPSAAAEPFIPRPVPYLLPYANAPPPRPSAARS